MKRYYISEASIQTIGGEREVVLAVDAHNVNRVVFCPTPDGQLVKSWVICLVNTSDHTGLLADPRLYPLPDLSLDAALSNLPTRAYTDLITKLNAFGASHTLTRQSAYRQLLRDVGRTLEASFNENKFDVSA